MLKPHIVILGAGFGGVYTAKKLLKYVKKGRIDVTIVNRTNYFLFTPLLHEVATGSLSPISVAEPLREIFSGTGIRIVQGTVESINSEKKTVKLKGYSHECSLSYDYLVIATGAETNYYDIPGAEKFSYPLKDLLDATRIRSRIIDSFEQAVLTKDPTERARLLTFVVIGGGATGVEVVSELTEFINEMVKRYYSATKDCEIGDQMSCRPEEFSVNLVHAGPEVLQTFSPTLRKSAEKRLRDRGVVINLNTIVTEVTSQGLKFSNSTSISTNTIIWNAGVKSVIPHFESGTPALVSGRLIVDKYFHLGNDQKIFAFGDVAGYVDQESLKDNPTNIKIFPMLAQVATKQADIISKNLIASIRDKPLGDFKYHSKGSLVSVGKRFAIGEIFSFHIFGTLTWYLWRIVYLFKFASRKKRIRIAFEWALGLVYPRDITKLT
ncbi:MAG: NAD(P)/FAD-dependent oxidoreductase [Patescibacteria group bacterium]